MDLWIRSQDKERLRLVDSLRIYQEENQIDFNIQDGGCILGTYKTKERALEVLDEIKLVLQEKYAVNLDYKNALQFVSKQEIIKTLMRISVYEMPQE